MNNEENKRAKDGTCVNVVDVAVLLLLVFAVLAFVHKSQWVRTFEQDRASHAYTVAFETAAVRYDVVDDLAVGTVTYTVIGEERVVLGSLLDEPVITAHTGSVADGGTAVDLAGTLLCHGVLREGALVLPEGCVLRVGDDLLLNTETSVVAVRVISITEIG